LSHASSPFIALVIFQTVSPALSWANLGPWSSHLWSLL
jgi:hypothetical protein